jgi:hypothetical protein
VPALAQVAPVPRERALARELEAQGAARVPALVQSRERERASVPVPVPAQGSVRERVPEVLVQVRLDAAASARAEGVLALAAQVSGARVLEAQALGALASEVLVLEALALAAAAWAVLASAVRA